MYEKLLRVLRAMELEERVLHIGILICLFGLILPWAGVALYDNVQQWGGFGYHTGYIGHAVFLIQLFLLAITISPILSGPILVRKSMRTVVRLLLSTLCTCLILAAFSMLLRLTFEVSGAEVRFGVYIALVGSAITTLYSFLRYQEELQHQAQSFFHHPDESAKTSVNNVEAGIDKLPPPPPPPPPAQFPPEDHHLQKHNG